MSKIVSRGFTGYGLDLNEHGLVVKEVFLRRDGDPIHERYPDEVLDGLGDPFTAVEGDGHLLFGIGPWYPWGVYDVTKYPQSEHEAKGKIASALPQVVEHEDGRELTFDEAFKMVDYIDIHWIDLD